MSERKKIAERFAKCINELKYTEAFGGIVNLIKGQKVYYAVGFSKRRKINFSGVINIYSPTFIQIKGEYNFQKIFFVFESEKDAMKYFYLKFVEHLEFEATKVPRKFCDK